jgi:hypothetical protein
MTSPREAVEKLASGDSAGFKQDIDTLIKAQAYERVQDMRSEVVNSMVGNSDESEEEVPDGEEEDSE